MNLICDNCDYEWDYKGKKHNNAQCPECNHRVKIPQVEMNIPVIPQTIEPINDIKVYQEPEINPDTGKPWKHAKGITHEQWLEMKKLCPSLKENCVYYPIEEKPKKVSYSDNLDEMSYDELIDYCIEHNIDI